MKQKQKTEVLQEIKHPITGREPFLAFNQPKLIINIHDYSGRSHNFLDGWCASFHPFRRGDTLKFQLCREYQVELTWWEQLLAWFREVK
jgi:hypothetical protein